MFTHILQITRQHVSTFLLNMRINQILLQVAAILLPVLLHLNKEVHKAGFHCRLNLELCNHLWFHVFSLVDLAKSWLVLFSCAVELKFLRLKCGLRSLAVGGLEAQTRLLAYSFYSPNSVLTRFIPYNTSRWWCDLVGVCLDAIRSRNDYMHRRRFAHCGLQMSSFHACTITAWKQAFSHAAHPRQNVSNCFE